MFEEHNRKASHCVIEHLLTSVVLLLVKAIFKQLCGIFHRAEKSIKRWHFVEINVKLYENLALSSCQLPHARTSVLGISSLTLLLLSLSSRRKLGTTLVHVERV